jgi:hypothetical protein
MSEHGDANPGGQGRMLHAMTATKELAAAGEEVALWFHGIGVQWLTAFHLRDHKFTQVYGPLFDDVRPRIGGACEFCSVKRFGAAPAAEELGVKIVGGPNEHHTVAALIADGYQVIVL